LFPSGADLNALLREAALCSIRETLLHSSSSLPPPSSSEPSCSSPTLPPPSPLASLSHASSEKIFPLPCLLFLIFLFFSFLLLSSSIKPPGYILANPAPSTLGEKTFREIKKEPDSFQIQKILFRHFEAAFQKVFPSVGKEVSIPDQTKASESNATLINTYDWKKYIRIKKHMLCFRKSSMEGGRWLRLRTLKFRCKAFSLPFFFLVYTLNKHSFLSLQIAPEYENKKKCRFPFFFSLY